MREREHGFTLVEMLISMLILVLVTGMLLDGLHLVTHHVGYESARRDRSSQIALVQNFLRAQLADAQPIARVAKARAMVDFTGGVHHLAVVSPAPPGVAFGGFDNISVAFDAGAGATGGTLQADWQPYRAPPGDAADEDGSSANWRKMTSHMLLDHVTSAAFSYFGSKAAGEPPAWHDTWQQMTTLPMLVRLSVAFSDGRTMPDLIVALRLATSP